MPQVIDLPMPPADTVYGSQPAYQQAYMTDPNVRRIEVEEETTDLVVPGLKKLRRCIISPDFQFSTEEHPTIKFQPLDVPTWEGNAANFGRVVYAEVRLIMGPQGPTLQRHHRTGSREFRKGMVMYLEGDWDKAEEKAAADKASAKAAAAKAAAS